MSRNLKPAHAGYRYQDIITAYFFVLGIIEKFDSVTVDKKQLDDDRFDDLQIIKKNGFKTRIQIKHSSVPNKELTLAEFTNKTSTNLTIDRLILTNKLAPEPVNEFRLCATWIPPSTTDSLSNYLIETQEQAIFNAIKSKIYKLDYEKIWPQSSPPIWKPLKDRSDFTRSDFIEFCEKFLIELNLPHASTDLLSPSRVETELLTLLHEKIGIGQYPNNDRKVEDVAALAIALATWARANESRLDVNEIVKVLGIRTDFGRIAQAFPLDRKYFYDRPIFRENILNLDHGKKFHVLMGPPGSGKSWELTNLSEVLKKDLIVARHYCYLDPTDENSERRITADVFFANLLAELQDSIGEAFSSDIGLSANLSNFENALNELVNQHGKIVLIIDGLDHISRVKSTSSNLNDNETDIIERLAALDIPDGVQLILGTQPGDHLTPILGRREDDVAIYHIPKWTVEDTIELCKLYELDSLFNDHGITNQDEIFTLVAHKSDSIPLYARYLCKGLISNLKENPTEKPEDWLNKLPSIQGDIKIYYKYLYEQISDKAYFVADLFSVIEFAITENELKEMFHPFQWRHVSTALKIFEPVFVQVEAQGGLRVFHESFRRFIGDELKSKNIDLIDILEPIITWMTDKGFYKNAKSYRFLLSALNRANKINEIYNLISFNFVSTSINYGHTVDAIQNNIAITANIAAHNQEWAILARCNELRRALYTYEEERLGGSEYWLTYGRLFGHQALSERLLFDGRPTLDYFNGMQACLIIDDMGGIAPWKEYFNIKAIDSDENYYSEYFDSLSQLKSVEENNLAIIQCSLSLGLGFSILRKIYEYLIQFEKSDQIPIYFIKCMAERLAKNDLIKTIEKLALKFSIDDNTKLIGYGLYWGLADFYHKKGSLILSKKYAEDALVLTKNSVLFSKLIEYGINIASLAIDNKIISSIDVGIHNSYPEKDNVNLWVAELRILAYSNSSQLEKVLNRELKRIQGAGWYRCWLKFTINIFRAEVAEDYNIKAIFNILLEENEPFVGEPRACDLYAIHGVIKYVISLGLKLVNTEDEWIHVLKVLKQVNLNTTTRLDREVNGPISSDVIFQLLEPYSKIEDINIYILGALKEEIDHIEKSGTYYSTHADLALKFTQVLLNSGNKEEALKKWKNIGIYLTSYGYRKDTTLFEIIDSVSVISHKSKEECLQALEKLQPLISSVLMHTDGRSTKHAPNRWFNELLNIAPESALNVLGRTIIQDNYHENWSTMDAYRSVANKLLDQVNPLIIDSLWQTLPFEIEYENEGLTLVKERLDCILKLNDLYPQLVESRLHLLAAQVSNDAQRHNEDAINELELVSENLGFPIKCETHKQEKSVKSTNRNSWNSSSILKSNYIATEIVPHPPEDSGLGDIIKCIRLIEKTKDKQYQNLNIYLSYKLQELSLEGKEDEAEKIIFFYGHEVFSWSDEHPLVGLAIRLKNAECSDLASICYTLAYMKSRGNGGWASIGGSKQKDLLLSAKDLNEGLAKKVFSEELGKRLKHTDYGAGITQSIIKRLRDFGYYDEAVKCWEEAFQVIEHRLNLTRKYLYFAEYKYSESNNLNINEGVILLILLRLSEPRKTRKISALAGFTNLLRLLPHTLSKPIKSFALNSTPTSSLLLMMEILYYLEDKSFTITNSIQDVLELYVNSPIWGAQVLSRSLLNRASINYSSYNIPCTINIENDSYNPYILELDPTNSLKKLILFSPNLPSQIHNFIHEEFKKESNKVLMRQTMELIFGRDGSVIPPVDALTWQDELFISELNNCGKALKENLEQDHLWSIETEEELVLSMLPDLAFHLGIYQSRVARPLLSHPNELTKGLCPINTVKNDPTYEGWVQLACVEHEYLNKEHSFSRPNEKVINISGITFIPESSVEPKDFFPLISGNEDIWWVKDSECIINRYTNVWNPIVGIANISDIFGNSFLLIPPLELLLIEENLIKANFSEKLCLRDHHGKEVIRLRSWEVHGDQISSDAYKLRGMDLIVHPEVFDKLNEFYDSKLHNYQFVSSAEIKMT
ncbi:ATP-binding protein [Acinetobacter sp. ANC 3791]|uniref:ATP-binding protein n=1 Tax=Acinetobacter sp. ANC 3791 TaxID=2529836 RepID=UPI00103AAF6D|nr:ATP-binding protein [Acinetobacter sp. ANC 3791]TCB83470.1 ATP-binding protein [Acinetobacter sp. ANC 3791]